MITEFTIPADPIQSDIYWLVVVNEYDYKPWWHIEPSSYEFFIYEIDEEAGTKIEIDSEWNDWVVEALHDHMIKCENQTRLDRALSLVGL